MVVCREYQKEYSCTECLGPFVQTANRNVELVYHEAREEHEGLKHKAFDAFLQSVHVEVYK